MYCIIITYNHTYVYIDIIFSEEIKHSLVVDIHRKRHITEQRLDRPIDLDTQYVRLKLLSNKSMGMMQRDALETPDHYQQGLEEHDGRDIQDEDLIKSQDFQKYVLVRGRAGIGKTTLVQRLLWRWANGEWATKFEALFLLNLRYLMTIDRQMDLSRLLSLYAVYNTSADGIAISSEWLQQNECKIGLIMGKGILIQIKYLCMRHGAPYPPDATLKMTELLHQLPYDVDPMTS